MTTITNNQIVGYQLETNRTIAYINSAQRITGDAERFKLNVYPWIQTARQFRVKNCTIPFTYYTIRTGVNDTFVFTSTVDGVITVVIPAGNYTPASLAIVLDVLITPLITGALTVVFNAVTGKTQLDFTGTTGSMTQANLDAASANTLLGFTAVLPAADPLIGNVVFNLGGPQVIHIHSPVLQDDTSIATGSPNGNGLSYTTIIHSVPVDVNSGSLIVDKWGSPWIDTPNSKIDKMDFELRFPDGELIDLNGEDWTLTLEFIGPKN